MDVVCLIHYVTQILVLVLLLLFVELFYHSQLRLKILNVLPAILLLNQFYHSIHHLALLKIRHAVFYYFIFYPFPIDLTLKGHIFRRTMHLSNHTNNFTLYYFKNSSFCFCSHSLLYFSYPFCNDSLLNFSV